MNLSHSKKAYLNFLVMIVILLILDLISESDILYRPFHLNSLFTVIFCPILIIWGYSVCSRIIMPQVRHCLMLIAFSLLMLFVIRTCKWDFFKPLQDISTFLWYMYYIPFITVPMLSFHASVRTGTDPGSKAPVYIPVLWGFSVILIISILTNNLHGKLLIIENDHSYQHGWLYSVLLIHSIILTAASFVILFRKCHLSCCRKQIYIPLSLCIIALVMMIIYLLINGSPTIFGIRLYMIQEVYCLLFIGLWEGCIIIGLLPSNIHYRKLFAISHTDAELISADRSMTIDSLSDDHGTDEDLIRRENPVSGGIIRWTEDRKAINRLNTELSEANEKLREEQDLIEEENRIMEEYSRYETLNRLYDSIAEHTRNKAVQLEKALSDTEGFEKGLIPNLLIGTYIKRCANMVLLSGMSKEIPLEELALAIRESFECMSITGMDCMLTKGTPGKAYAEIIIAAFDLFEAIAEKNINLCSVISVSTSPEQAILMKVETDGAFEEADIPDSINMFRSYITIETDEDETCIVFGGDIHE